MDTNSPNSREGLSSLLRPSELPKGARRAPSSRASIEAALSSSRPPETPEFEETPLLGLELLLGKSGLTTAMIDPQTRQTMAGLLDSGITGQKQAVTLPLTPGPAVTQMMPAPAHQLASHLPAFSTLKSRILEDLETHLNELLKLNSSRREAVTAHLDRLAGQPLSMTSSAIVGTSSAGPDASATCLRKWIEGPRSRAQNAALQCYFEEIALVVLGQAVLLKAWSDRGLRAWSEADLKDLNWAMNTALKPHIPLDRETWQVASRNLYSWYKPTPSLQKEIWSTVDGWRIASEGPAFLASLLSAARKARAEFPEPEGYDSRFFDAVWSRMQLYGFNPAAAPSQQNGVLRKAWAIFTPTLRDGSVVRTGPVTMNWIGLDASPFQLMSAELLQLWWGQSAPPLWAIGTGLEVPTRDQLMLNLGSPKPSLLSRIAEMEACDAAFVLEERAVRAQGRASESQRFREQADSAPYFKKLRAAGTTLGDLQSCAALSKLRPGGLLWWSRETPLGAEDGRELLAFLLERGKLLCEWNFSDVEHALPSAKPLFPKYLYLFQREPRVEERLNHRPLRMTLSGQIRSHVELPLLLEDALQAPVRQTTPRGQWKLALQQSPMPQREWAEHWPDAASQVTVRRLENLREFSLPLASATTIRPTPDGDPTRNHTWFVDQRLRGFWIQAATGKHSTTGPGEELCSLEKSTEGRRLVAHPLPYPGSEVQGSGFMILVADENSVAPLKHYLESDLVSQWLEHHCERKGDRWVLTEQAVRWIPVPRPLLRCLGLAMEQAGENAPFALPLPGEWETIASKMSFQPSVVRDAVKRLRGRPSGPGDAQILADLFVRASRTLEGLRLSQGPILSMVSSEGRIRWLELLKILPQSEMTTVTLHPRISVQGNLPLHLPVVRIAPIKAPAPGFMLSTEAGLYLKVLCDSPVILEMLGDQMEGLNSPTWSELLQYLRLPRRIEVAESAAHDVLRAHGEQTLRIAELVELLAECTLF